MIRRALAFIWARLRPMGPGARFVAAVQAAAPSGWNEDEVAERADKIREAMGKRRQGGDR